MYNNFEVSIVVLIPIITTNHAIACSNYYKFRKENMGVRNNFKKSHFIEKPVKLKYD